MKMFKSEGLKKFRTKEPAALAQGAVRNYGLILLVSPPPSFLWFSFTTDQEEREDKKRRSQVASHHPGLRPPLLRQEGSLRF